MARTTRPLWVQAGSQLPAIGIFEHLEQTATLPEPLGRASCTEGGRRAQAATTRQDGLLSRADGDIGNRTNMTGEN